MGETEHHCVLVSGGLNAQVLGEEREKKEESRDLYPEARRKLPIRGQIRESAEKRKEKRKKCCIAQFCSLKPGFCRGEKGEGEKGKGRSVLYLHALRTIEVATRRG